MDLFSPEYLQALLSPQAQASLTEKLIVVVIVWLTMGRKVSKRFTELKKEIEGGLVISLAAFKAHLEKIEKTLSSAVTEITGVKENLSKDLSRQSDRLNTVEDGLKTAIKSLDNLNNRLERVEQIQRSK